MLTWGEQFENSNVNTRDLKALQAFMLCLEVGMWSGFKRKIEISESFILPLLTVSASEHGPDPRWTLTFGFLKMLRRAGMFSASADSPSLLPLDSDSAEVLEAKWQKFISRESYKR